MSCSHSHYVEEGGLHKPLFKGCLHCRQPFDSWAHWKYGPLWYWFMGTTWAQVAAHIEIE